MPAWVSGEFSALFRKSSFNASLTLWPVVQTGGSAYSIFSIKCKLGATLGTRGPVGVWRTRCKKTFSSKKRASAVAELSVLRTRR